MLGKIVQYLFVDLTMIVVKKSLGLCRKFYGWALQVFDGLYLKSIQADGDENASDILRQIV